MHLATMNLQSPFGTLTNLPENEHDLRRSVSLALNWCHTLLPHTLWSTFSDGEVITLRRTINQQLIELLPLQAAMMDFGMQTSFEKNHLPVKLNHSEICIASLNADDYPLHTDMVASMLMLLAGDDYDPMSIPRPLHPILTPIQRATSGIASPRNRYVPGRPSTTGRVFLPEAMVLRELSNLSDDSFLVQFEKRDGSLRLMTASLEVPTSQNRDGEDDGEGRSHRRYNPADYHLKTVQDIEIGQTRSIATDRITMMAINGRTVRTESAED